jgi:threonine dehydrogenase-like Zn-dependent dehydrogenase
MRAITYRGPHSLALESRPAPRLSSDWDVVVSVRATGVCGTDRQIYLGNCEAAAGIILGHEAMGIVDEIGSRVQRVAIGDRVVINPTLFCGRCRYCSSGRANHCERKIGNAVGIDRDGTFAEFIMLPEAFVAQVPPEVNDERAALIEPLACVLNNARAVDLAAGERVVIIGGGPIGLIWGFLARHRNCSTLIIERDPFRSKFAGGVVDHVVSPTSGDVGDAVREVMAGYPPRVVVDTTGTSLVEALSIVDQGGTVVVMGFDHSYGAFLKPSDLVTRGVTILGAGDYLPSDFDEAIRLSPALNLDSLVTHRLPLNEYAQAFEFLSTRSESFGSYSALKILLYP